MNKSFCSFFIHSIYIIDLYRTPLYHYRTTDRSKEVDVMLMVVRIYLATIGNPGTLEGMLYGNVRRNWARTHHPKWYKEVGEE
jgi:cytochrome b subunit of formate dehydrogenase